MVLFVALSAEDRAGLVNALKVLFFLFWIFFSIFGSIFVKLGFMLVLFYLIVIFGVLVIVKILLAE